MKEIRSCLGVTLGGLLLIVVLSGFYTFLLLTVSGWKGVYANPETGMRSILDRQYSPDRQIKFLYAGTNSFDGSKPYVWFVIYEVRASSRTDGLPLYKNGCDSGSRFFLDIRFGWVPVSEGAFPEFMGYWMNLLGMAGPGRSTPSTNWAPNSPAHYCE
jgi:hypothetical protein